MTSLWIASGVSFHESYINVLRITVQNNQKNQSDEFNSAIRYLYTTTSNIILLILTAPKTMFVHLCIFSHYFLFSCITPLHNIAQGELSKHIYQLAWTVLWLM